MSVMSCHRNNCENIMCDRYSSKYGYICNDCFDELLKLGPQADISDFMNSTKPELSYDDLRGVAKTMFDKVFPIG